jgi:hypothetical protein
MNLERFKHIVTGLIAFAGAYLIANATGVFDGTVFHLSAAAVKNIMAGGMAAGLFSKSIFGMSIPGLGTLPGAPTVPANKADSGPGSMRALVLFLALAGAAMLPSCATTTGTTPGPATSAPVQIAADCGAPAVRDIATHLVDDVASALLTSGDWHQALVNLGATETQRLKTDAWPAIMCAVQEIGARTSLQLGAKASMNKDAADQTQQLHERAVQWAAEHRATPVSYRGSCRRACPPGERLTAVEPQAEHVDEDCCVDLTADDPNLATYSSCAWNVHLATGWPATASR